MKTSIVIGRIRRSLPGRRPPVSRYSWPEEGTSTVRGLDRTRASSGARRRPVDDALECACHLGPSLRRA